MIIDFNQVNFRHNFKTILEHTFSQLFIYSEKIKELETDSIKLSKKEYKKLVEYIEISPINKNFIRIDSSGRVLIKSNLQVSTGEMKWISNIIAIIMHKGQKKVLAFDDPLDSLDSFYSAQFLRILENNKLHKTLILTHRTNIMRYGIQSRFPYIFYNLFLEKIDHSLISFLASKSFIDFIKCPKVTTSMAVGTLIFMRFSFKNISHVHYEILSEATKEPISNKASTLKPIIIDILGHEYWNKIKSKFKSLSIFEFVNMDKSNFTKIINKVVWKETESNSYISTMRHLSESEPLDIFLIDKKMFDGIVEN